jgi:hypothetical protein
MFSLLTLVLADYVFSYIKRERQAIDIREQNLNGTFGSKKNENEHRKFHLI